ncbi:MAG TPA: HD domain-containing phosphohydrolase [Blastocatellia bacterium]|nr:HD domain-containing phosphohydrolase [Blastocatellia bacterium]
MQPTSKTLPDQLPTSEATELAILVIDDDRDTCDMISALLSRDYRCDTAYDGQQALARILETHYSAILADLMMPCLDGYAVINNVSAMALTTPVIVVTGLCDTQSAIKAMRMGAFDYMIKPFDPDQLELSVKRAVSHHILSEAARRNEQRLSEYAAELERTLAELDSTYHSVLSVLTAALETRNIETRSHSDRVVAYSLRLGREMGLDESQMKALELGALLHDIGKIGVEDRILLKPKNLNQKEWELMRRHTEMGARLIEGIPRLHPALAVITQHHERWDGRGYPAGLAGEQIDIKARVFAVADALDAITSDRPYDKSHSFEQAREEIVGGAGKQFDPGVVEAFCRVSLEEWKSLAGERDSRDATLLYRV